MKGLYPTLFPGGSSVTRIPFTQSESARSKPVSASGPLCLHTHPLGASACTTVPHSCPLCLSAQRPTQPSSGRLSSVLPPLQPLLCSPTAFQLCHSVVPRALGGALYIESVATYFPHVCSELANQGQVESWPQELSFYPHSTPPGFSPLNLCALSHLQWSLCKEARTLFSSLSSK